MCLKGLLFLEGSQMLEGSVPRTEQRQHPQQPESPGLLSCVPHVVQAPGRRTAAREDPQGDLPLLPAEPYSPLL